MTAQHRHKYLLRLLAEHGSATIPQLSLWLGVSAATVRRDVQLLDTSRQLRRTHGSVKHRAPAGVAPLPGAPLERGMDTYTDRKRAIARKAASLCADGETLLISGGSTTLHAARFLAGREIRVVTNSFAVARYLLANGDNEVILSGGKVYPEQGIILSPFESEAVQHCYADKLLIGVHCVSSLGLMEADPLLIQAGRRLIQQAQQVYVLADSSKFGNKGGMFLCGLEKIHGVITDTAAPDAVVQALERSGVQVMLVDPEQVASAH